MSIPIKPYHKYSVNSEFDGDIIENIYFAFEDYLIYKSKEQSGISVYYDDMNSEYKKNRLIASNDVFLIQKAVNGITDKNIFYPQIALFYKNILEGQVYEYKSIIDDLLKQGNTIKFNIAKRCYIYSGIISTIVICLLCFLAELNSSFIEFHPYHIIMLFGSLGGMLSLLSIHEKDVKPAFYHRMHYFEGFRRIIFSAIAAVISYLFIKVGVIKFFGESIQYEFYFLIAVLFGYSEKSISKMMKRLSKMIMKEEKE